MNQAIKGKLGRYWHVLETVASSATSARAIACPILRSLPGVKRTWVGAPHLSVFDPKRTSDDPAVPEA